MNDLEDAMISAGIDDELEPEERARLEEFLSDGSEHAARASSFRRVDEELRSLALQPIADERLAATLETLRGRLGFDRSDGARTSMHEEPSSSESRRSGRWWLSSALAAAAAVVLYLASPALEPRIEESPSPPLVADPEMDEVTEAFQEELVLVLGYGDEISELSTISNDDLDVIERLDLLDFLSAREVKERG